VGEKVICKINTIRIEPDTEKNNWRVTVIPLREEYEFEKGGEDEPRPSPLGFYHCPDYISVEEGIEKLKALLVERHKDEIDRLKLSMYKLKSLTYKN